MKTPGRRCTLKRNAYLHVRLDHPASSVREQQEHATAVCASTARRKVRWPVDRMNVIDMDLEQSALWLRRFRMRSFLTRSSRGHLHRSLSCLKLLEFAVSRYPAPDWKPRAMHRSFLVAKGLETVWEQSGSHRLANAQTGFLTPARLTKSTSTSR
jgi:hypothetical protein